MPEQEEKVTEVAWRPFTVRWEVGHPSADWDRIQEAARRINAREHLDLTASDIVRKATRAYLDSVLGPANPVEDVVDPRTGRDRRKVG